MFKIIAIQTLIPPSERYAVGEEWSRERKFEVDLRAARRDSVMRILKTDQWFWFVKGYSFSGGRMLRNEDGLPDDFFSEKGPYINVSALVAENGMGKSSLLELLFRIINNTAYALRSGLEVQQSAIHFVRDIYARVWVEGERQIYYLEQRDNLLKIHKQDIEEEDFEYDYDNPKLTTVSSEIAKKNLKDLFYTIVVNYSQFAYNTNDYLAEWDEISTLSESADEACWLSSLFHKNDAYQTPIVLNPFREQGNIDINRERELTQTRLYNLVLNEASPLKRILLKKDVESFIFDINEDLNPIPGKRYYSKKVVMQMRIMHLLNSDNDKYKTVNDIGWRITAAWGHVLGYEIESRKNREYWDSNDDVRTVNYIVYKTLKVSATYAQYFKYQNCFNDAKKVLEYVAVLYQDNSHITLKIRRCLAFLFFHHYSTGHFENGKLVDNIVSVFDFKKNIDRKEDVAKEKLDKLLSERRTTYYWGDTIQPHVWKDDELMPAPSFNTDILLAVEDGDNVRFSSLSSGEKQMVFCVSAIIYQLFNIESAWDGIDNSNVRYKSVCLVFDEIELYAHPKYQLMLVNLLIESIKSLKLKHVQNVDILMSTHSPFVLSDIPDSNILCLKDGKAVRPEQAINSFCANVYDILNNQFFMDRFVGDFANKKLDALIEAIHRISQNDERKKLILEANRIGDTYIRKLLLKKLEIDNDKDWL